MSDPNGYRPAANAAVGCYSRSEKPCILAANPGEVAAFRNVLTDPAGGCGVKNRLVRRKPNRPQKGTVGDHQEARLIAAITG